MIQGVPRISIFRPILIVALAFLLALAIERFSFSDFTFLTYAGNTPYRLVYSELKGSQSILWLADPTEPTGRRKSLLTIDHQYGYGVVGTVSPDGSMIAYGFLPTGRRDAFSQGQLWVATIDNPSPRLLATKMDLHFAPIWSPDGSKVLMKTVEDVPSQSTPNWQTPDQVPLDSPTRGSLIVVSLEDPVASQSILSAEGLGPSPIGWSQDGRLVLYHTLSRDGTAAGAVDMETFQTRSFGKLADGPVWDVKLSPDYRQLLYVTAQRTERGVTGSVWLFDIENQRVSSASGQQQSPVGAAWHSGGERLTHNGAHPSGDGAALLSTNPTDGVSEILRQESDSVTSVPISWSPDSDFLAVRRRSLSLEGRVDLPAIIDVRTGVMKELKGGYAEIVGWTSAGK